MNQLSYMNGSPGGELLLGVDGGGTKTEVVLARRRQDGALELLGFGNAGPANIQSVSPEQAWLQCLSAIEQAAAAYAGSVAAVAQPLPPVNQLAFRFGFFAMAGAGSDAHAQAFADEVLRSGIVSELKITHDARPLIGGGTSDDSGIALIAGTGSFAYGRTATGSEDICGGWGYLYGDEGSGYAMGIAGLRAAVMAQDGRAPATALLREYQQWLEIPNVKSWLVTLRNWDRDQIAQAARVVCQCASAGDRVAGDLVNQAADALALHISTVAARSFAHHPINLVYSGGLLVGDGLLRDKVTARVERGGHQIAEVTIIHEVSQALFQMLQRVHQFD